MWSELGHAYLAAGQVPDAIAAYIRSNDTSKYAEVIDACKGEQGALRHGAQHPIGRPHKAPAACANLVLGSSQFTTSPVPLTFLPVSHFWRPFPPFC